MYLTTLKTIKECVHLNDIKKEESQIAMTIINLKYYSSRNLLSSLLSSSIVYFKKIISVQLEVVIFIRKAKQIS